MEALRTRNSSGQLMSRLTVVIGLFTTTSPVSDGTEQVPAALVRLKFDCSLGRTIGCSIREIVSGQENAMTSSFAS
jgi:hypothetical protein